MSRNYQQGTRNNRRIQSANAPYNFIPLNETVIQVEAPPSFDKFHNDRFNGFIELQIETKTPLFIRGVGSNFFRINELPKIPGSSLRGMISSLIEIVTYGKFHFYDDYKLFYRWIADQKNLRKYYQKMIQNVEAGYLNYENSGFFIIPAKKINGKTFYQTEKRLNPFTYQRQKNGSWIINSGSMEGKKRCWVINKPNHQSKIIIPAEDSKIYEKDKNRNICIDLLESAKKKHLVVILKKNKRKEKKNIQFPDGIPIFYVKLTINKNTNQIIFGHTRNFRVPYKYSTKDHIIPKELIDENIIDFSQAIFGKKSKWASRIFFEDANLIDDQNNIFFEETSPKILASPKPTCIQHYLEQEGNLEDLKHWDDKNIKIRGYKIFWHKKTLETGSNGWSEGRIMRDTQHTIIKPIKPGVKFKSRIKFENLSKIELGALLFVLNLPQDCCHKIGMAKPLGLGSIQITSKLFLIDRIKRYESLFDGEIWNTGINEINNIDDFIRTFEKYIIERITKKERGESNQLWNTPRLKLLRKMLNWKNTNLPNWLRRTRYMDVKEFKFRRILPRPDDV
ncbi:MAG: TIGR03986 family type III CRISPR-associated RAMP protein [Promethearchaeota archaeon]